MIPNKSVDVFFSVFHGIALNKCKSKCHQSRFDRSRYVLPSTNRLYIISIFCMLQLLFIFKYSSMV